MSYIDNNLLSDEQILFRTKKHIIIFFVPACFFLLSLASNYYIPRNMILKQFMWVPWLVTLIFWVYTLFEYWFSDYAVTNRRILMREGFIYRHTTELRLATISQINVEQSLVGQLLNYGTVSVNTFGAFDGFALVANPNTFQKQVNEQLDKINR